MPEDAGYFLICWAAEKIVDDEMSRHRSRLGRLLGGRRQSTGSARGTGGGGAPVAIAGSFLIGLGFKPFQAATLCLIANTAPVAWGAVGTPIRVLMIP